MNKRNAKLIRKYAARNFDTPSVRNKAIKKLKRAWRDTPRPQRFKLRQEME